MKILCSLLIIFCLIGCSPEFLRPAGKPFRGYSCRESIIHFLSNCSDKKLSQDSLDSLVNTCEGTLATKVCDKELAALLWCMGRVAPGTYTKGGIGGVIIGRGLLVTPGGQGSTVDGCDCSTFMGDFKECRIKNGIFE